MSGPPTPITLREALAETISAIVGTVPGDGATPQELVALVGLTSRAGVEVSHLLRQAVGSARAGGASWESIGRELGMSRQAAHQRFGGRADVESAIDPAVDEDPAHPARRILGPVTAFTELEELRVAGRLGWHSIDFSAFRHVVEQSDTQWEHRRVAVVGPTRAALERQRWQVVGAWFPWVYLKRDTGVPALPPT